jgi:hypothetical protein
MLLPVVASRPAMSAVITVDGQPDDLTPGICDLAEAIENANDDGATNADCEAGAGADEIQLTVDTTLTTVDNDAVLGPTGLPAITSVITIEGNDHTVLRDAGASDDFRIFLIESGGDLTLNQVIVSGGLVNTASPPSTGGGIHNAGTLTLNNSTVSGNSAAAPATGLIPYAYGGGIYNGSTLTLSYSVVTGNDATSSSVAYGGGVFNKSTATISNSTISANSASVDADTFNFPIVGGGGLASCSFARCEGAASAALTYSTISGNDATVSSTGAIFAGAYGGGILNTDGTLTAVNSTISGNSSDATGDLATLTSAFGGGIDIPSGSGTTLTNSTLSGNSVAASAGYSGGGGLFTGGGAISNTASALTIANSLIANSTGDNCFLVVGANDAGNNLADDASCDTIPSDLAGLNPTLADNGGATETHALEGSSNAIDLAAACALSTDQRGVARPAGLCDSGSYEFVCAAPDGESQVLEMDTLTAELTVEVCGTITVGPDYTIMGPDGHLIARAGGGVEFVNGFSVTTDGRLTVEIDPSLQQ